MAVAFIARRLEGLSDEPRPGAPRKLSDDVVEAVVVRTLEGQPPRGETHWSTRSMAKASGLNQTAISRIWRAFGLKPHLVDDWKLSTDPQFIEKVRDIVGLYLASLFAALDLATGKVIGQTQRRHRHQEFLRFPAHHRPSHTV